jgi:hypothetical protein
VLFEDYGVHGWISSFTEGHSSRFVNFRDCLCPVCRDCHGNQWSLSNTDKFPRSTLVICHKTAQHRLINQRLPF